MQFFEEYFFYLFVVIFRFIFKKNIVLSFNHA